MRHEWDFAPGEDRLSSRARIVEGLAAAFEEAEAPAILEQAVTLWGDRLAMVSSFGAESVVLLHMAAAIDSHLPVIFIDTELLFPETLQYQREVADMLGLRDVRRVRADPLIRRLADPADDLHARAPDMCCHLRKTVPLDAALAGFDGWVTGRKRHQTEQRAAMPVFEQDTAGRIKVNPLARWLPGAAAAYIAEHRLPPHPLVARGFASLGCRPCTEPVGEGEDSRAGRWRGKEKTECGIHFGPGGALRAPAFHDGAHHVDHRDG